MSTLSQHQRTLTLDNGRLSYLVADKKLGWNQLGFSLGTHHGTGKGGFEYYTHSGPEVLVGTGVEPIPDGLRLRGKYSAPGLEEAVDCQLLANGALRVVRRITNTSKVSHVVRSAAVGGAAGGGPVFTESHIWRARYAHMDNVRTEKYPWCRPEFPYVRCLPKSDTTFGNQESQAVPAMILTNDTYSQLLLEGQLRQDRTRACWTLSAGAGQPVRTYELHWGMATGGFELAPGGSLELEPIYYQIMENTHPQELLDRLPGRHRRRKHATARRRHPPLQGLLLLLELRRLPGHLRGEATQDRPLHRPRNAQHEALPDRWRLAEPGGGELPELRQFLPPRRPVARRRAVPQRHEGDGRPDPRHRPHPGDLVDPLRWPPLEAGPGAPGVARQGRHRQRLPHRQFGLFRLLPAGGPRPTCTRSSASSSSSGATRR